MSCLAVTVLLRAGIVAGRNDSGGVITAQGDSFSIVGNDTEPGYEQNDVIVRDSAQRTVLFVPGREVLAVQIQHREPEDARP